MKFSDLTTCCLRLVTVEYFNPKNEINFFQKKLHNVHKNYYFPLYYNII